MDYNLYTLNSRDFEHIIQALMQKILGNSSLIFGEGRDGARELTYRGKGEYDKKEYDGYWVIQAKFKSKADLSDDFDWVKKNYNGEIRKFRDKRRNLETPQNYIFFTNVALSGVSKVGGIDRMQAEISKDKDLIPNVIIVPYDAICRLLDNNRDVATSYASFLLSGDILQQLYDSLQIKNKLQNETLARFIYSEFKDELNAKLIQAGDLNNQVKIEKVFVDLYATETGKIEIGRSKKFVESLIPQADICLRNNIAKIVLIGEAGAGKSTLTQYLMQMYSAFFLKGKGNYPEINSFFKNYNHAQSLTPKCLRFPLKIVIKEYADWIKDQKSDQSTSVISYLTSIIRKGSDIENFQTSDLLCLLSKLSFIFLFDGLDEVPSTSNRGKVVKEINHFIDSELSNECDAIVIATTRPQGFSNEFSSDKFRHLKVCELPNDLCLEYLNKLLFQIENSAKEKDTLIRILKDALMEEVTGRLMRTPLQATIMTLLVKSGGKPSQNRYLLFKEYYDTILKREKQKGVYTVLKDYERLINEIHFSLAHYLQKSSENDKNPSAYISSDEFKSFVEKYLHEEEYDIQSVENIVSEICNNVTERLVFISEVQDGRVGFVIRSMQEFFAANYFISKSEDEIIDIIELISKNIYWRNTLLFLIGGIHTNGKRGLVQRIIHLFNSFNGIELKPQEYNSNSILKEGAWLALDILIEGTFVDSPKFSNAFSSLLEPLFDIPFIEAHEKIANLPPHIIKDWVLEKYIKTRISEFSFSNQSIFKILISLDKEQSLQPSIRSIVESFKPQNPNFEMDFLSILYRRNDIVKIYKDHLTIFFEDKSLLTICDFIKKNNTRLDGKYYFTSGIPFSSIEFLSLRRLLELYVIGESHQISANEHIVFYFTEKDFYELISNEFDISEDVCYSDEYRLFNTIEIKPLEWYKKEFSVINPSRSQEFIYDILIPLYKKYNLNYIVHYYSFIANPTIQSVKSFLHNLFLEGKDTFELFLHDHDFWYFTMLGKILPQYALCTLDKIDNILESIPLLVYEDDIKNHFDYMRYLDHWTILGNNDYSNYFSIYYNILSNNSETTAKQEVISIVEGLSRSDYFKDKDIERVQKEIIVSSLKDNSLILYHSLAKYWADVCEFIDFQDIASGIDLSDNNKFFDLDVLTKKARFYFELDYSEKVIKVVSTIFNFKSTANQKSNIIYLVPIVIGSKNINSTDILESFNYEQFSLLKFCEIKDQEYQILIQLILSVNSLRDKDQILLNIYDLEKKGSRITTHIVLFFIGTDFYRIWVEDFVCEIIQYLSRNKSHYLATLEYYYFYLKRICEEKSTQKLIDLG